MINFIAHEKQRDENLIKLKKSVMTVSTACLVVYLVLATGLGGWWWLWTSRQKKSTARIEDLKVKIDQLAKNEDIYRQVAGRVDAATTYIANRDSASAAAAAVVIENFTIEGWEFNAGGPYVVRVNTGSADEVQKYIEAVKTNFSRVQPLNINYTPTTGWTGEIQLSGRK